MRKIQGMSLKSMKSKVLMQASRDKLQSGVRCYRGIASETKNTILGRKCDSLVFPWNWKGKKSKQWGKDNFLKCKRPMKVFAPDTPQVGGNFLQTCCLLFGGKESKLCPWLLSFKLHPNAGLHVSAACMVCGDGYCWGENGTGTVQAQAALEIVQPSQGACTKRDVSS